MSRSEEIISVDSRPVRDIGNSIGQSFDKDALETLGLLDEDGTVKDDVEARQTITEDGRVVIDLPVDQ